MKKNQLSKLPLDSEVTLGGGCLCGGVRYQIKGKTRGVVNCFCSQCRKTSGHYVAATRVKEDALDLIRDETLSWYTSSPGYQRGFCHRCGGNLFWSKDSDDQISVMAGTLNKPTGLKTISNLYPQDASDYFELPDLCD